MESILVILDVNVKSLWNKSDGKYKTKIEVQMTETCKKLGKNGQEIQLFKKELKSH